MWYISTVSADVVSVSITIPYFSSALHRFLASYVPPGCTPNVCVADRSRSKGFPARLRMEAARAMCGLADGFRVTGEDQNESYVEEVLSVCADLADAYLLAGSRLSELGFSPDSSLKCFKKAHELAGGVDTA